MTAFDRRLTPARPDLAAEHLRGTVAAPRYAVGEKHRVIEMAAPLRAEPVPSAPIDTEALFGETFTVYETEEGWAWGQVETDGYVGWLAANALGAPAPPTHRVTALRTFVYPSPSIKSPATMALTFGSNLAADRHDEKFLALRDGGFVFAAHATPAGGKENDPVAVAERFLGVPYLWGGKTSLGIDCSGLVQTALAACGIAAPRDSDMQEKAVGEALDPNTPLAGLRRGDLLFWPGHVAMVRDRATMIHATGHTMSVIVEDLEAAIERIAREGGRVRTIRRCAALGRAIS